MIRVVYVATKNAGKLRELQAIFRTFDWELRTFEQYADVEEGGDSYGANAALKARALRAQLLSAGTSAAVLGDDSGLEVDALGGRPGVHSARYGGADATWTDRRRMILDEVAAGQDRSASFVCALHFIAEDGWETAVQERLGGEIADRERGERGFSYDPIFVATELAATFGEVDAGRKNALSHRALAARALVVALDRKAAGATAKNGGPNGT